MGGTARTTQVVLEVLTTELSKARTTQVVVEALEEVTTTSSSSTTTTTEPPSATKVSKGIGYAVLTVPDGTVVSKGISFAVLEGTSTSSTSSTASTTSTTVTQIPCATEIEVASYTPSTSVLSNRSYRNIISSSDISNPNCIVEAIRVQIKAGPSAVENLIITGASIGLRSGSTIGYVTDEFIRLTFDGGSDGCTLVGASATKWSDWVSCDFFNPNADMLVHLDNDPAGVNFCYSNDASYRKNGEYLEAMTQSPSGYSQVSYLYSAQKIEVSGITDDIYTTTSSSSTTTTTEPPPAAEVSKGMGYVILTVPDGSVISKGFGYAILQQTTSSSTTTTTTTSSTSTTTTTPYPVAKTSKAVGYAVLGAPDGSLVSKGVGFALLQEITTSSSSTSSTASTTSSTATSSSTSSTASTTSTHSTTSSTSSSSSTSSTASSSSTTTTPPPEYWHTDFREYEVDVSPTGWTEKWHPTSGVPTIRDDGVIGTNCLEIEGADERYGLSWDVVGDQDDIELLAKVRVRADVDITAYLVARGSGTGDADENAYYACLYNSSNLISIRKYVSGGSLSITSDAFTIATDSWYWMRFRVFGSSLKLKVWADGEAEPGAWSLEDTDTDVTGWGWAGAGTFYNGPDYDYFSVATNGGIALSPAGTTTTTTSSSTTTSTHTYTGSTTTESSSSTTSSTASTTSSTSSTASSTSTYSTTSSSSTTTTTTYPPCFWNDDFTGNDLDPPAPLKWSNDSTGIGTASIATNKLQIHNGGGGGNLGAVSSRGVFSGDFETEVDIDGIITPFEDSWSARFQVYINATNYLWLDMHFESATDTWSVGYRKGGGEKYPDSVARVNDFGALKITRTGSIIRTYIDDGRTGSWTEINVGGQNVNAGDATISFQVVSWEFEAPLTIDWDNFYVNYDGCPESVTSTTSSTTSSTTTTVTVSSTTTSTHTTTSTSTTTSVTSTSSTTASTTSTFSTTTSTASSTSTYSTTSSTASTTSTHSTTSTTETGWTSTSSTSSTASTTSTFSTTSTTETGPPPPDIASYTMVVVTTG